MKTKEYRIGDLFDVTYGKFIPKSKTGSTPLITTTACNNGVGGYVDYEPTHNGNSITVASDGSIGAVFYQDTPFITNNIVSTLEPKEGFNLTKNTALYIIPFIKAHAIHQYSWDKKYSVNRVRDTIISLPVKSIFSPDYAMIENLAGGGIDMSNIDTSTWRKFKLGELFDIENTWIYGKDKKYKTKLETPDAHSIAVISGTTANNGVNYYTNDVLESSEVYCDCLTMSTRGNSGKCFYHDEPFCLANNVLAMPMPGLSKNVKMFFGTAISKLPYGDNYSNYPTKDSLKDDEILLPCKETEEIDFDFMEKYIRAIEKQTIARVYEGRGKIIEKTKEIVFEKTI